MRKSVEPNTEEAEVKLARRRRGIRRRVIAYGSLVLILTIAYKWQPMELDFIPRHAPVPDPAVNPDKDHFFAKGTKVLVITAHPDDSEFYIGGTTHQLAKSGAELHQIVCTDGDKGYYPFSHPEELRRTRRAEQTEAAKSWNAVTINFLGYPDGRLRNNDQTVAKLAEAIRLYNPEYVLAFDGDYPPRLSHQDHRRSGDMAELAVQQVPSVKWLLKFSTIAPNFFIDTTDQWFDIREGLSIHKSQFSGDKLERVSNMVASLHEMDGEKNGTTQAEGFRVVKVH